MVASILLHHDAVTGTHKKVAYRDYLDKIDISKVLLDDTMSMVRADMGMGREEQNENMLH